MKFICAQPAIEYYTWQVEVMINNFIRNGVNPNDIEIVCAYYGSIPNNWKSLADKYNTVKFFFYKDSRINPSYISSIRPHILYKHWLRFPELAKETIFYHDCDIVFSKPIEFFDLERDGVCYVSDTVSYIGANYIKSKGEHYFDLMTKIVNINKDHVIREEKNSGGAQYIIKNVGADFWSKVYYDCETMYRIIVGMQNGNPSEPFQIWCADMWAVLWNLWTHSKRVEVTSKLSFSWATSPVSEWDKHQIYHNAGVVDGNQKMFFKGQYQNKLPYDINIEDYDPKYCSTKYAEEVIKIKPITCLK